MQPGSGLRITFATVALAMAHQLSAATATYNNGWSGGSGAGGAPTSADAVVIEAGNLTWGASLPGTVASWLQSATYAGTVTFETVYGTSGFTNFAISGNCVISNGVWMHKDNTTEVATPQYRLKVSVDGNFTLVSPATINVDMRGYDGNQGPGNPTANNQGGAYGGLGGKLLSTDLVTTTPYGSITEPTHLGSGGQERPGGGAVYLRVGGAATISGIVSANGDNENVSAYKGSGGSIYLRANSLSGNGTLRALGGLVGGGVSRCGGGGGRIAVILNGSNQSLSGFTGSVKASGGTDGLASKDGGAGTIYLETAADGAGHGRMILDNDNLNPYDDIGTLMPVGASLGDFTSIVITNQGRLIVNSGATIDFSTVAVSGAGADQAFVAILAPGLARYPVPYTLNGYTLTDVGLNAYTGTLTIGSSGRLTHLANRDVASHRLNLTVHGNLTVATGGRIDATVKGFASGLGPGAGTGNHDGGGHGGVGGAMSYADNIATGYPYDQFLNPTNAGSGAASTNPGGGIVLLTVTGTTHVAGSILANGASNPGSAGGTVRLATGRLTGNGTIQAQGGDGVTKSSGAGGRIAVYLTNPGEVFTSFAGTITAHGGYSSGRTDGDGAAGSVYRETAADGPKRGTITIDNLTRTVNLIAGVATELPPSAEPGWGEDLSAATFKLQGTGRLRLTADAEVGDIVVGANARLVLGSHTLTVNAFEHNLGDTALPGAGNTSRVDHYDQIVWRTEPTGTTIFLR